MERQKHQYISTLFQYACDQCGNYLDAFTLLSNVKYDGEIFRRIPGMSYYYLSLTGRVLSLRSSNPRLLKVQQVGQCSGCVRPKTDEGFVTTRTIRSLRRLTFGEDIPALRSQSRKRR